MKTLIVYSSLTGNTKKIADAMGAALDNCDVVSVKEKPSTEGYDMIACGYWVDKGMPDNAMKEFMATVKNAKVATFGTLGAWPDSPHAQKCMLKSKELLEEPERGNTVLGTWLCQGKVDPKLVEAMQKMPVNVHPMTLERKARLEEAAKHPDEKDCLAAAEFIRKMASLIR